MNFQGVDQDLAAAAIAWICTVHVIAIVAKKNANVTEKKLRPEHGDNCALRAIA
ncbi:hypothetical protein ACFS07_04580 [Undibacterium arcticum]